MALVSVVVPVYHNAGSLPDLLAQLQQLAATNAGDAFEFVFVDDGSRDNSAAVIEGLLAHEPRIRLIQLSRNFGSNTAILAGLNHTRGDVVAVIAADLQDPPELIHDMLAQWRLGRKIVLAARAGRDDPWLTTLLANTFYKLFRRFAIATMPRYGFDFFLVDAQIVHLVRTMQEKNAYLMGLLLWVGFDPAVLYYHRRERPARYGQSMWTLAKKLKYFADSFVAFSYAPVRAASLFGASLSFLGLLYACFVVFHWLFGGHVAEGWASLMVVLLVVSGTQMVLVGILGEYLCRTLDETRKRPPYVVDRVVSDETDRQESRAA